MAKIRFSLAKLLGHPINNIVASFSFYIKNSLPIKVTLYYMCILIM